MLDTRRGWITGSIGMLIFSGSLPATRAAVATLDPMFVTWARAAIAGMIALAVLYARPRRGPTRGDVGSLAVVAGAVVVGFPLLTALALRQMTAADALVFVGLIPLATAVAAQWRGDRRPHPAFWGFAIAGSALVATFSLAQGAALHGSGALLMLAAVAVCGIGYAEGARLSRRLGGWQVIAWALVLALPLTLPLADLTRPVDWTGVGARALLGLAYVSVFSMLVGFVFWYDGLARGGTAAVGQLQLLQPFFGLLAAGIVLHETVAGPAIVMLAATLVCAAGARHYADPRRLRSLGAMARRTSGAAIVVATAVAIYGGGLVSARASSFPERLYDDPSSQVVAPDVASKTLDPGFRALSPSATDRPRPCPKAGCRRHSRQR